jgi:hypothetical protein
MAGNANSGRKQEKPFRDALRIEIADAGEEHQALRKVAKKLLKKAQDGDLQAIKELADRTDGKVPQGITGDGDEGEFNVVHRITREVVRPKP